MANLEIGVDFYDDEQKGLIKTNFPQDYLLLEKVAGGTVGVSLEDFKTYAFFRHQYSGNGKTQTFLDVRSVAQNWGHYDYYFMQDGTKLINIFRGNTIEAKDVPEMLGVAGGLSVASSIYGMTQADWTQIPATTHRDFDFRHISCLEDRFINLEAKGSIVSDNSYKTDTVSKHKGNILLKKNDSKFKEKYDYQQDTCIGIITVADKTHRLQSWIVDPRFELEEASPLKIKLLKRLYFYLSVFRLISPRSYLSVSLANKIRALEATLHYGTLDNVSLVNHSFETITVSEGFLSSRSGNGERSIIGGAFLLDNGIYFVGIEASLLNRISKQNFEDILSIRVTPRTTFERIFCKMSVTEWARIVAFESPKVRIIDQRGARRNQVWFEMDVELIRNSAGLCVARHLLR